MGKSLPSAPIDQATQGLEDFRQPLDFIQNHQARLKPGKVGFRVDQFVAVAGAFKVKGNSIRSLLAD